MDLKSEKHHYVESEWEESVRISSISIHSNIIYVSYIHFLCTCLKNLTNRWNDSWNTSTENKKTIIISYLIIDWIVDFFSVRSGIAPRVSYTSSNRTKRRRSWELQFAVFCNPPAMKSRTCWRLWSLSITEIHAIDYS